MINPLIPKLEQFRRLSTQDRAIIVAAAGERVRRYEPREDVISEGDQPRGVNLFLSGWACRYKQLRDGRRQILAIFLPGDLCDHNVYVLREMDHSIAALTSVTTAELSRESFSQIALDHPHLMHALWWETLVGAAVQREWTLTLGQRNAIERISHLFCELFVRLRGIGLTDGDVCDLPMTQMDLSEAMGMSPVHVNRTLQEMRSHNLIVLKGRKLTIPNLRVLMDVGLFDPAYLHMELTGAFPET